ncbi:hypothetical protein FDECE_11198 [Fusarium decemcellulare]|nr:hypothetical protein FDECE_11198 [Fusarium decemcellulare]
MNPLTTPDIQCSIRIRRACLQYAHQAGRILPACQPRTVLWPQYQHPCGFTRRMLVEDPMMRCDRPTLAPSRLTWRRSVPSSARTLVLTGPQSNVNYDTGTSRGWRRERDSISEDAAPVSVRVHSLSEHLLASESVSVTTTTLSRTLLHPQTSSCV